MKNGGMKMIENISSASGEVAILDKDKILDDSSRRKNIDYHA